MLVSELVERCFVSCKHDFLNYGFHILIAFFGLCHFVPTKENYRCLGIMVLKCRNTQFYEKKKNMRQCHTFSHSALIGTGSRWLGQPDHGNKGQ